MSKHSIYKNYLCSIVQRAFCPIMLLFSNRNESQMFTFMCTCLFAIVTSFQQVHCAEVEISVSFYHRMEHAQGFLSCQMHCDIFPSGQRAHSDCRSDLTHTHTHAHAHIFSVLFPDYFSFFSLWVMIPQIMDALFHLFSLVIDYY